MFHLLLIALEASRLNPPVYNKEETIIIPGQHIVVLKKSSKESTLRSHIKTIQTDCLDCDLIHEYNMPGFKGYAIKMGNYTLNQIRKLKEVDYIEQDSKSKVIKMFKRSTSYFSNSEPENEFTIQTNVPWGLGRISSKNPLTSHHTFHYK